MLKIEKKNKRKSLGKFSKLLKIEKKININPQENFPNC